MDPETGVREVVLGEAGIAYVREMLGSGGRLARALDPLDLSAGTAMTFLPNEMREVPEQLQYGLGGLSEDGFRHMRHETRDKIMSHFVLSEGRGWAMSEDRYNSGLGRFITARVDGRETRFKVATVGDRGVFYLSGPVDENDVEDFIEAARIRANVSALGVGGPLTSPEPDSLDWQEHVLPQLAEHVRVITCEAFDEEGLVFWERAGL